MDPITSILIPMGTSFVTALLTKGKSGGPLQTLDDCWELVFGKFHLFVEKKRALHEQHLNDYKNKIAKEVIKIPAENLQDPELNIIGPALEASKFFIESEVIREMFAKVIASSMDNRKSNQVHSCYVEIIKQLSPLDAQNIALLKQGKQKPVAEYQLINKDNTFFSLKTNIFLSNEQNQDIELNAISLSNLNRLGLVTITYIENISDESKYLAFSKTEFYKQLLTMTAVVKNIKEENDIKYPKELLDFIYEHVGSKLDKVFIKKGLIKLTPLGESFAAICC